MYNYKKFVHTINFNGVRFVEVLNIYDNGTKVVDVIRDYSQKEYNELEFMASKFNEYVSTYQD